MSAWMLTRVAQVVTAADRDLSLLSALMWYIQVLCLEVERLNQEDILSTFRDSLQCQQDSNSSLRGRLVQFEQVEASLHEYVLFMICDVCVQMQMFTADNKSAKP